MKTYLFNQSPSSPLLDLFRSIICKDIISIKNLDIEFDDNDKVIIITPIKQDKEKWKRIECFINKHKNTTLLSLEETCEECKGHLGSYYEVKIIDAGNDPAEKIVKQLKKKSGTNLPPP